MDGSDMDMMEQTIDVTIEIPYFSLVKYEVNKDNTRLYVDRVLSTSMVYPGNYGYVDQTMSGDGDPIDVLVINTTPFYPGSVVKCRVLGVLFTEDEKGHDEKIIAVPHPSIDPTYECMKDVTDIPTILLERIRHFFQEYKSLEKGKHVIVKHLGDAREASLTISQSRLRYMT